MPVTKASPPDDAEAVRSKLEALGVTERDVAAAVRWARREPFGVQDDPEGVIPGT